MSKTVFDILKNDLWLQMTSAAPVAQQVTLFDGADPSTKMQTVYSYSVPSSVFPTLGSSVFIVKNGNTDLVTTSPQTADSLATVLTAVTGATFTHYTDSANANELYYTQQGNASSTFDTLTIGITNYSATSATKAGGTDIEITLISALSYNNFVSVLGMLESYYFHQIGIYANSQAQLNQTVTMTKFRELFGAKLTENFTPSMNKFQPQFVFDPYDIHFPADGNNTFTYNVKAGETVLWRLATKAYNVNKALGENWIPQPSQTVINSLDFIDRPSYELFMSKTQ